MNVLIVADPQFGDLAGNLRRDACDLHAHATVPGPRRRNIIIPCHQSHDDGDEHDGEGREPPEAREVPSKRDASQTRRAALADRRLLGRRFLRWGLTPPDRLSDGRWTRFGGDVVVSRLRSGLAWHRPIAALIHGLGITHEPLPTRRP